MFKNIRVVVFTVLAVSAMFGAPGVNGAPPTGDPFILSDDLACTGGAGFASDVTFGAPASPALGCWGEIRGNDWSDAVDGDLDPVAFPDLVGREGFYVYSSTAPTDAYSGTLYERVAKQDEPSGSDSDNGYDVQISMSNPGKSGTWSLSGADANLGGNSFLLAIKASNEYVIWLFAGDPAATSYSGTWEANWGHDLSHMSIYAATGERPEIPKVPLPSTLALLFLGGLLMSKRVATSQTDS